MQIHRIYVGNTLRNYNYIIACENTKDAVVIDPLDVNACLNIANKNNLNITKIFNTHEHWDHIEGNEAIVKKTGAKIYAHKNCKVKIANVSGFLVEGDTLTIGNNIKVNCIDTPGHTFGHICFLFKNNNHKNSVLFSGDTLFNAGAGNCYSGDMELLYQTFTNKLALLDDNTLIYPGHDYLENNLNFTLSIEPDNIHAQNLLKEIKNQSPEDRIVTNLDIEKKINSFFRLSSASIKNNLSKKFNKNIRELTDKEVFFKLRELRNNW